MVELTFLFNNRIDPGLPNGLLGWIAWFALLILTAGLLWRWREYNRPWTRRSWMTAFLLALAIPITVLLIPGVQLPIPGSAAEPMLPKGPTSPVLVVFGSLPWVLAGGLLGPLAAAVLAALCGLFLDLWAGYTLMTPLVLALLATFFGAMVQQNYRTRFYRWIRQPLVALLVLSAFYPALYLLGALARVPGSAAIRLDYAIASLRGTSLAIAGSLLLAGIFAEVIAQTMPARWGKAGSTQPSPGERSISARFFYGMAPFALLLVLLLMVVVWVISSRSARQLLDGRMANAAEVAVDTVPIFTFTGHELMDHLAQTIDAPGLSDDDIQAVMAKEIQFGPFFSRFYLFDENGELVVAYNSQKPESGEDQFSPEETNALNDVMNGIEGQVYAVPSLKQNSAAELVFTKIISDRSGDVHWGLLGYSDLSENPLAKPMITGLQSLSDVNGEGMLIDDEDIILYHPDPDLVMTQYGGERLDSARFYTSVTPVGTRMYSYYRPVQGAEWSVIISVPAIYIQQQAMNIAAPVLAAIFALSLLAAFIVRYGLNVVTRSLDQLTVEADRIAAGALDKPLAVEGVDEAGKLRRAFEQMRASLSERMAELNRLLLVSQGVAASLDLEESLRPVLESALSIGASAARVVLDPSVVPGAEQEAYLPAQTGIGLMSEEYRMLDDQVLDLTRQKDPLVLTNLTRPRLLAFSPGSSRPEALLGLALRHENQFYGAMWVGFEEAHQFTDEEIRFLSTLAGNAALAAANASLFMTAEVGRQRLEAILASTPDPVLVTDHKGRLLLSNPAAWQVLGTVVQTGKGQPIDEVIHQTKLIELMSTKNSDQRSAELIMEDGKVYFATASPIQAEGRNTGRVCILRDVTHFKELDALKSDFVSTVSHDLRSPLTLIRGYATMLQMVGELNDQQSGYVHKIISGVESMSRLVNNLLDLGRIEAGVGLQLEMVPIHDIVERVVSGMQMHAVQKRIHMDVDIPQTTVPVVEADPALLEQALHNLVENAVKYTESGGNVQVSVQVRNDQMIFKVTDNGIGIAPADLHRLFEKFYRAVPKGANRERGSGLGLAIVKSIAERHGGGVWVESHLGKGSTFFMAIPMRPSQIKATLD